MCLLLDDGSGYLRSDTIKMMWTPVDRTKCSWDPDGSYAMGWGVVQSRQHPAFCRQQCFYVTHTGGAVGASSVLVILPRPQESGLKPRDGSTPQGVVVAIVVNLQSVGMNKVALQIAKVFESVRSRPS